MFSDGVLIVGASQAGAQLATSLRDLGALCPITLVGAEPHLPYQRPPLSKAFLSGKVSADEVLLRSASYYTERDIDVVTGQWIESIEVIGSGGTATSARGRTFAFDQLALTVGGTPRRLHVPGADLGNVFYLRDLPDAIALRDSISAADRVLIVGGGFIGLEAAAVANAMGKQVVVVEALDRLMARAMAPVVSDFYLDAHRRRGVCVMLGTDVVGMSGNGTVSSVELSDGSSLPTDLVLVGVGLAAHTELAEQLGIEVSGGGIVVDEQGRTSRTAVVSAGDCTTLRAAGGLRRIESVANAIAQARAAAATLAGVPGPPLAVPWFWSDQGDLKLQTAGLSAGFDDVVLRGNPESERFAALYYRHGELIAIDAINAPRDYMAVRKILESRGSVPREAAADSTLALKSFIRA
ncbi:FAD-dependent oxidoreductase [Aeromicrobium sp.]|uniref:NAD(P)/FAD-dependent oxidoreductase n=1 Tax=Aeromicrobium sp. TaxID=1871063 RepID=UPI0025C2C573|nr:FAD-dependent oxidoreductase [Aeromicrobium sp.]